MRALARTAWVCKWLMVLLGLAAAVMAARGQVLHADGPLPAFEVASVRPSAGGPSRGGQWRRQGERFVMKGVTLEEMAMFAYGLGSEHQITGASGWMRSDRFDVEGKLTDADEKAAAKMSQDEWNEQMRLRMQRVLAERFLLQAGFEKKEMPVYVLKVAKSGFRCTAAKPGVSGPPAGAQPHFFNPLPPQPIALAASPGPRETTPTVASPMNWRIRGWPVWYLVRFLTYVPELSGRPIVDRTGLSGDVDCDLSWVPLGMEIPGPSLFTAVQEQLGLKVDPGRAAVEVVNLRRVERPSEN